MTPSVKMKTRRTQNSQKQSKRKSSTSVSTRYRYLRKSPRLVKSSNTVDSTAAAVGPQAPPPCSASTFYRPLDEQKQEFRLLTLFAGADSDAIECRVDVYSTEHCPEFEALSYYWGDPTPTTPITINGVIFKIGQNLGIALPYLRQRQTDRVLWIDAICINQADISERNHQVRLMHQVFSTASTVLAWLGEASNDSDALIDLIEERSACGTKYQENETRKKICDFACRPWWSRMWIVQEVALATSDPLIICGRKCISWTRFIAGCANSGAYIFSTTSRPNTCKFRMWMLQGVRRVVQRSTSKRSHSLCETLRYTGDFEASDPRDRIFGCLGLLDHRICDNLQPDYLLSVDKVYLMATKHILAHEETPFFSEFSFYGFPRKPGPSWVPDFADQPNESPNSPRVLMAKMTSGVMPPRHACVKDGDRLLEIRGFFLDTVNSSLELRGPDRLLSQIVDLEKMVSQATPRPLPPLHPFRGLEREVDVIDLLAGNYEDRIGKKCSSLRRDYEYLTWRAGLCPYPQNGFSREEVERLTKEHLFLTTICGIFPGRYFFSTNLGFAGVSVCPVRSGDVVTYLGGEKLPTVLRPRGLSYTMVGSASVQGIMLGELLDMYKRGLIQSTTFAIR